MLTLERNLERVRRRIHDAAAACGRPADAVSLIAVSKTQSVAAIQTVCAAGQRLFGESYTREAVEKIQRFADSDIEWHFIGPIQSNKTKTIAEHFAWAHSIDRVKIAQRLNDQRPPQLPPLQVCLQVNISREPGKEGVMPDAVWPLAEAVATLPRLSLRGLMTIPLQTDDIDLQHRQFRQLYEIREQLIAAGLSLDTLSMGMSDDLEAAIAEGSTMVRIGTAIFGERSYS